jgi:hypothetical protein
LFSFKILSNSSPFFYGLFLLSTSISYFILFVCLFIHLLFRYLCVSFQDFRTEPVVGSEPDILQYLSPIEDLKHKIAGRTTVRYRSNDQLRYLVKRSCIAVRCLLSSYPWILGSTHETNKGHSSFFLQESATTLAYSFRCSVYIGSCITSWCNAPLKKLNNTHAVEESRAFLKP